MTLTLQKIFECQTANGGWTRATLEAFGMRWREKTPGWPRRIAGREISEANWQAALTGRNKFVPLKNGNPRKSHDALGPAPDAGTPASGGW